jgi:hypothetical protein
MRQSALEQAQESGAEVGPDLIPTHPAVTSSRPAGRRFGQLPGQLAVSVEESASLAVTTCFIATARPTPPLLQAGLDVVDRGFQRSDARMSRLHLWEGLK